MGELVSMVASWSESKEQLIGLFLWVDPLPRARTWTRWGICRCNRVAREGSLLDSARRGYPSSHLPPQTTPKKKVTNNTRRAWDLTARRTASFLLNAPLPPHPFYVGTSPPLLVDRGEIEYTPHVEVLCAWPAVVWNSDFWSGWWSWMFVVWDLLLPSLLRDAALKEQTHFGPMLCRVTLYYLWPHYRLATILFIIDQAKNELEVLTEQLEKLEKQTQYTTGEKKRPQKQRNCVFWSTCI